MEQRWIKIVPHINDTLLLASAIYLAVAFQWNPLQQPWLAAKIIGLFVYIGLGFVVMRLGKTKQSKAIAWVLALVTFAYMMSVAFSKSPLGFLA